MPLYRVLETLSFDSGRVVERGVVSSLKGTSPQTIAALLRRGRISEVQAPPLRVLPGWEERAEVLEPLGIETVNQLVDANLDEVAEELDTPVENLRKAAQDAQQWTDVYKGGN